MDESLMAEFNSRGRDACQMLVNFNHSNYVD